MQTNRMQHVLLMHRVKCENHADANANDEDDVKSFSSASGEASTPTSSSVLTVTRMVWWKHLVLVRDDVLVELDGFAMIRILS